MTAEFGIVYLDTEALTSARWPRETTEMHNLLSLSQQLKILIGIPRIAELERERQWVTSYGEDAKLLLRLRDDMDGRGAIDGLLRDVRLMTQEFSEKAAALKVRWGIQTIPSTSRTIHEVAELAIKRRPPFEEKNSGVVGFQDAAITCPHSTICGQDISEGFFVSRDKVFFKPDIDDLAASANVKLTVVPTISEVISQLKYKLEKVQQKQWASDVEGALKAVRSNGKSLREMLARRFEGRLQQFAGVGEVLRLSSVDLGEIKNLQTPPPTEHRNSQVVMISFDVSATLNATVEYPNRPAEENKFQQKTKHFSGPQNGGFCAFHQR